MTEGTQTALKRTGAIGRNIAWNLGGETMPLLAAVVSIPLLVRGLGTERFGVLSLAFALLSYFGIFDVGLGRALTKLAADRLAVGAGEEIPTLFRTAFVMMLILSIGGGAAMAATSPWLVYRALAIPAALRSETVNAFYILALSLPLTITTSAFRGLLSAFHRFDLANAVRIPLGVSMFLSLLLVLPFSRSLVPAATALLAVRSLGWLAYLFVCLRIVPELVRYEPFRFQFARSLLSFGGWITVSSVVSPAMLYFDRFVIGAMLSTAAVAYYATPCDSILKLSAFPSAVAGVLFPVFANSFADATGDRAASLIRRGSTLILIAIFPVILVIVTLAREGLTLWLGYDFSLHSAFLVPWLAVGILVNSMGGHLPYVMIQGAHRPDITAKLNLIEMPLYLFLLYLLVHRLGLEGAAIAWSLRLSADAVALWVVAETLVPEVHRIAGQTLQMLLAALAFIVVGAMLPDIIVLKSVLLALSLSGSSLISWLFLLDPEDRLTIAMGLRRLYRLPA